MPQLEKGGKYVFGWSRVRDDGNIKIPPEAIREYKISPESDLILFSGSKTSGGFVIAKQSLLERSMIGYNLKQYKDLSSFQIEHIADTGKRKFCRVGKMKTELLTLSPQILTTYRLKYGDYLLSVRGSYIGISMIVKGPIIDLAKMHPEINTF